MEHTVDNLAVTLLYAKCDRLTAADWIRQPDRDIWHEIAKAKKEWGNDYKVNWHRSHPERRATPRSWSALDWGVFDADNLVGHEDVTGMLSDELLTRNSAVAFKLLQNGSEVTSDVPAFLRQHYLSRRACQYAETKNVRGLDWRSWSAGVNRDNPSIWTRVQTAKLIWGWLATAKTLPGRVGHEEDTCPCCGEQQETNWHMFAECLHPRMVQVRKEWAETVTSQFSKHPAVLRTHSERQRSGAILTPPSDR